MVLRSLSTAIFSYIHRGRLHANAFRDFIVAKGLFVEQPVSEPIHHVSAHPTENDACDQNAKEMEN